MYEKFNYNLLDENGMWMKSLALSFSYACSIHNMFFWHYLSCKKPFSDPLIYLIKVKIFAQKDKFSNKIDMFSRMKGFFQKMKI